MKKEHRLIEKQINNGQSKNVIMTLEDRISKLEREITKLSKPVKKVEKKDGE